MRRFLAFDIETAKVVPEGVDDILAHRPLGIACAAAIATDLPQPLVWHGRDESQRPSGRMTRDEAARLVAELSGLASQGYTLLTWNGLHFDFDVLAEESGQVKECARLAADHVDMLFHVLCSRGHRVSLQRAAEGMRLPGKKAGISGALAPAMWASGRHDEVLNYCIQDVRLTLQLAEACERAQQLAWITQRGSAGQMPLRGGWLTVLDARALPLPDTSWMSNPPSRDESLRWIREAGIA
ncbi:MAG: ribonuclease H-like domain-containing protein [Bryobacteraceae bacterium]